MKDNNKFLKEFGIKLKEIRFKQDLTQEEVSLLSGIRKNYYADLENGRRNPTLLTLIKVSAGLKVPLKEMVDGIGDELKSYDEDD